MSSPGPCPWAGDWLRIRNFPWPEEAPVLIVASHSGGGSGWRRGRARHVNGSTATVGLAGGGPRWVEPWSALVLDLATDEGAQLALAELRRRGSDDDLTRALQLAGRMP